MKLKFTHFMLWAGLLAACSDTNIPEQTNAPMSNRDTVMNTPRTATTAEETYNDGGPPFSDSCLFTFEVIGEFRSGTRLDQVISGKGWNPDFYSCSWTWGEYINNQFPEDTTIKDFRIHLVDLDKLPEHADFKFLSTNQFREQLIATYSKEPGEPYMSCKFDPNHTGKYPKPKQWLE